jgi:ornithine decarboxylase
MSDQILDATNPRLQAPYDRRGLEALMARFGSPLVVIDCDIVRAQFHALSEALPGVDLHYALKPLPERCVVDTLKALGGFFDLATNGEVDLVRKAGVDPRRCIHTHPIKRDSDIREAIRFGVRTFVADNPDELGKFVRHRARSEVLLRVAFRNPAAAADLSRKFGCEPESVPALLDLARRLGVKVVGLSFHVGSQTPTPDMHVRAIDSCRELIIAARAAGHALSVLDIGGGFPVTYQEPLPPIHEFCAPIREALAKLPPGLRLIAEPGRFIAGPAGTSLSTVVGRALRDGRWWFYLDDGLYGSYNGQMFDHAMYSVRPLRDDGSRVPAVLAGPTCDSIDVVREQIELPMLEIGDVLVGQTMGAYTSSSATDFNFIRRAKVIAINEKPESESAE